MKHLTFIFVLVISLTLSTHSMAQSNNRANAVFNCLVEEGYIPKYDKDGDICFKAEGFNLYIDVSNLSEDYIMIVLPAIYDIEEHDDIRFEAVELAMLGVCKKRKVVKARFDDTKVTLSAEMFTDPATSYNRIIPRAINALIGSQRLFYDLLIEINKIDN